MWSAFALIFHFQEACWETSTSFIRSSSEATAAAIQSVATGQESLHHNRGQTPISETTPSWPRQTRQSGGNRNSHENGYCAKLSSLSIVIIVVVGYFSIRKSMALESVGLELVPTHFKVPDLNVLELGPKRRSVDRRRFTRARRTALPPLIDTNRCSLQLHSPASKPGQLGHDRAPINWKVWKMTNIFNVE